MPEEKSNLTVVKKDGIEIRILRDKCISAGTCTVYAPETFDLDEEGIATVKAGDWDRLEKIIAGAESCPVFAIEVYQDGNKVYPRFNSTVGTNPQRTSNSPTH